MSLLTPLAVPCYARVPRSASAHRGTDRPPVDGLRPCTPFTKQPPDQSTRARPLRDERSPRNGTHPSRHRDGASRTHTHRRDPTNQNTPHHTSHHPRRRRDRALTTPHNGTNRDGNETTTHPAEPHHPATHTRTPATRTPQDELREEPHNGTPPQRTANEKNPHRHTASGASGLLYAPTAAPVRAVAPEDVLTHSGTRDARHNARSRRP